MWSALTVIDHPLFSPFQILFIFFLCVVVFLCGVWCVVMALVGWPPFVCLVFTLKGCSYSL
jgi:hypothetical protein